MIAAKGNKVYTITEQEQPFYQEQGFDIMDGQGDIVAYGKGKTVPYEDYAAVVVELEALKIKKSGAKGKTVTKGEAEGAAREQGE